MNHSTRKKPLSLTALTVAISMANSSISYATPTSNDTRVTPNGLITNVDLTGNKHATLDWTSFDLASNESVIFNQQGSDSVAVNNISGAASEIFGSIEANGHVFLVNENGFTFGKNAVIDTQGFLATTFSAVLSEGDVTLSPGTGSGTIDLDKLDIAGDTQYVAFYSPAINVNGSVTDQTTGNDTQISLSTQALAGDITLPGLPINFSLKVGSNIIPGTQTLTIKDESTIGANDQGTITSQNGTVILNTNNINDLLNSNITLPKQITAKNLIANVTSDTKFSKSLNFNGSGIENFTLNTTKKIDVENFITGSNLDLTLKGSSITVKETASEYGNIGGSNGLNNVNLMTNNSNGVITLSNSIRASDSLSLIGDINITDKANQDTITLIADNNILLEDVHTVEEVLASSSDELITPLVGTNLNIITENLTLGNLKTSFDEVSIFSDNITLTGSEYLFKNKLDLTSYTFNQAPIVNISNSIKFDGSTLDLTNATFNLTSNNIDANFGSSDDNDQITDLTLENINMLDSSNAFNSFNLYIDSEANGIDLSGNLRTKVFSINKGMDSGVTINTSDSLYISDLQDFDIGNSDINALDNIVSINGNSHENSSAEISNVKARELSISGFNTLNIRGSEISTQTGNLILNANQISLTNSDIDIKTESGRISISSEIAANNNSVRIKTGSEGFNLSGISNANNIIIEKSGLTNLNTEQSLSGDYIASGYIDMNSLGSINLTSDVTLSAEKINEGFGINLQGTKINSVSNISIKGDDIKLGEINAAAISVSNYSDASNGLYLTGNLIANDPENLDTPATLDLNVSAIELLNDLTLEGDINFLDAKTLTNTDLRFTDSNELAPTINGSKHLTLNAKNQDDVYLYNFGETTKLASLTLNGEGRLHMVGFPNISNSSGLSILGKWDWDIAEPLTFTTDDYDLNLSGVNLNAVGEITFDTGSGSLSLGSIGSKGTVTELIIKDAGSLNLHGDINLVGSLGYDFSNVGAINLHKDMTFGSQDLPSIVNFGDADINGTFDLNIYSNDITLGRIGSNEALQDLNIFSTSDLVFDHSINLVGNANITANKISINNEIRSTGLDINLNAVSDILMSKDATLHADYGNITLDSQTGDISLGALTAKSDVVVKSHAGYISNAIGDYVSNDNTSSNITSNNLTLLGKVRVGDSVANPIVIDIQDNGVINVESDGNIYIANRNNAGINSQGRVIDTTSKSGTAIIDAFNLIQTTSMNSLIEPHYKTTLGLIENSNWQLDEEDNIKTIKTPNPSPNLYYSRQGWRLGY